MCSFKIWYDKIHDLHWKTGRQAASCFLCDRCDLLSVRPASCATTFSLVEVSGSDVNWTTGDHWQRSPAARFRLHRPSQASQPPGIRLLGAYHRRHQARRDIWLGGLFNTDPRRLWEFLEWIGAVTHPPTGNERERERESCQFNLAHKLKRTKNVLNGNEMRETWIEVLLCKN